MITEFIDSFKSPLGQLSLLFRNDELIRLDYSVNLPYKKSSSTFSKKVISQLENYFGNSKFRFSIPFITDGTPYQEKVWQALQKIPCGTTKTYGDLAKKINSSPRAVGNACRENPLPIIIPCHRIIAKNTIGGYAGASSGEKINIKKWLLQHEQKE